MNAAEPHPLPRLLVAGVGPLPPEAPDRLYAPGLRLWGMARELARAGHPVRLVERLFGQTGAAIARIFDLPPELPLPAPREIAVDPAGWPALLRAETRDFQAAAAIGSTDVMNHALAEARLSLPLWCDFFGDPLAERQMLAVAGHSDEGLPAQWALYAPALARADALSGCSAEQAAALLGELGTLGRLNQFTAAAPLVHVLRPWLTPLPAPAADGPPVFRGAAGALGFPAEAFVVVQTGGFNTWLDHETLFAGLELAMAREPRLYFAATGGAIAGHYAGGFEAFAARVAASPLRARFRLLGWLPLAQIPCLLAEADAGLNIDRPCPEGRLGTRNRLLDWALAGLPVLTTPGCPLAEELATLDLAELVPHGDAPALAEALTRLAADSGVRKAAVQAALPGLQRAYAPVVCLAPLLKWAAAPRRAPDLQAWEAGSAVPPPLWLAAHGAGAMQADREALLKRTSAAERRLAQLEGSRWVRLALKLRGDKGL